MGKISAKHKRFVNLYLKSFNGTQAAIEVGYAPKGAATRASEILKRPEVKAYMKERLENQDARIVADADECLAFLSAVLRGEVRDAFALDPSLADRLKAADALLKRYASVADAAPKTLTIRWGDSEDE